MTELDKLENYLKNHNYEYDRHPLNEGEQIVVFIKGTDSWDFDAVCSPFTYGGNEGLLEIMGTIVENEEDEVEGYLTTEEIIDRLEKR